jgi:hypothetical protein
MKRSLTAAFTFAFIALLVLSTAHAGGTKGSWTGWLTDESCGAKGANAEHKACATKCLAKGGKLVFYNTGDQKIYSIDSPDKAKEHLGHEVKITGTVEGTMIAVESIEMAAPK